MQTRTPLGMSGVLHRHRDIAVVLFLEHKRAILSQAQKAHQHQSQHLRSSTRTLVVQSTKRFCLVRQLLDKGK
jgi:hypothetical protein